MRSRRLKTGILTVPAFLVLARRSRIRAPMPFDGLLEAARDGRPESQDRLFRVVYDELRSLARRQLERAPRAESLHPTALVHEAYVRLVGKGQLDWRSRRHFFALVARAMRDIVVERARYYSAQKRGGGGATSRSTRTRSPSAKNRTKS